MSSKKYQTVLTVIIVVVIIIIVILFGKMFFDIWDKKKIKDSAEEAIIEFDKNIQESDKSRDENISNLQPLDLKVDKENFTYGGYNMMGYIEIPKIDIKYPVLETLTTRGIEIAVAIFDGVGLNEIGNTIIVGHNYRNGVFFSELHELEINDSVYITDRTGTKIKYKVYNIFTTTPEDESCYDRDTEGKREITLATCSDTGNMRTVVFAREASEEESKPNTIINQITTEGETQNINLTNNN